MMASQKFKCTICHKYFARAFTLKLVSVIRAYFKQSNLDEIKHAHLICDISDEQI